MQHSRSSLIVCGGFYVVLGMSVVGLYPFPGQANTFINDSNIISVPSEPPETPVPDVVGVGSVGGENETVIFNEPLEVIPEEGSVIETVIIGTNETNTVVSGGDAPQDVAVPDTGVTSVENPTDTDETASLDIPENVIGAESILQTLSGSQAVSVYGSAGSGGVGNVSVFGARVREALRARGITTLVIPANVSPRTERIRAYSRQDVVLIASAIAVTNPEVSDIFFSEDTLTITYEARGRLFFALPFPYTTRVSLTFSASTPEERVAIRFPWYTFLMWTGVSRRELRLQFDAAIDRSRDRMGYDRVAYVLEEIRTSLANITGVSGVRAVQ